MQFSQINKQNRNKAEIYPKKGRFFSFQQILDLLYIKSLKCKNYIMKLWKSRW